MSLYIKGMEMPVTCCHCPLMGYDPDREWFDSTRTGAYICVMTHELIDNTKREGHCPLVEIPPHGRLIDADAIRSDIDEKRPGRSYEDAWALTVIDAAPTIIPSDGKDIKVPTREEGET